MRAVASVVCFLFCALLAGGVGVAQAQSVLAAGSPPVLSAADHLQVAAAEEPPPSNDPAPATTPLNGVLTNLKFNGLIQGWYLAASGSAVDTFRVRRTELKLSADIGSKASWVVMIDPSKSLSMNKQFTDVEGKRVVADASANQASRILQDAFITITPTPKVAISVGQFKLPLGFEGLESSANLGTVERALFLTDRARGATYGDIRDVGAIVRGKAGGLFDYHVGFFDGAGQTQNDVARADLKMVAARLWAHPGALPGLTFGVSAARAVEDGTEARQDRTGFDVQYVFAALTLRAELMTGRDASVSRRGYYAHAGYMVAPQVEVVARFDAWDPDTALDATAATVEERDYTAGANYLITGSNLKWQVNLVRKTFATNAVPARTQLSTNLQVAW